MRPSIWASLRGSLATRLLAGQVLVLLAGAITAGAVAAVIGPPLFHDHLLQAGLSTSAPFDHVEMAYRDASLISLGVGLAVALVAATMVTWFSTRRLRHPIDLVTGGAREISRGHYDVRIPAMQSGTELDDVAAAFNTMADRLQDVENTRRRMLADLAHELRTPIATLVAYHDGLHDHVTVLGEESRAALSAQTERLTRLADDIDDVVTAEEGRLDLHLEACAVPDLLWAVHDEMRDRYAHDDVRLVVDGDEPNLFVTIDRRRMTQALINLLTNALRHCGPGDTVTLTASRRGGDAVIAVVDTGDGIPPTQLPHLFERFYRGDTARDRDRAGSGIGLTITKAIVDAHRGHITAASDGPGHGARLTITLPLTVGDGSALPR